MYARMVIGEALSEDNVREFSCIFKEQLQPALLKESGYKTSGLLIEEGGNMVIVITDWESRDHCLKHHSSRLYRQFVAKTQHLLIGEFVVKLFRLG